MRIIELFAGIGACSKALENIGIDLEIVDAVEIDKYAIQSFNAIHKTRFNSKDISKFEKIYNNIDIITHGSPCQDFSIAGKQEGGDKGSGTRSSLMYETIRIVEQIKPKYILWENVKNLLSKKHKHNFDNYISTLDSIGYNSYYKILNAKDYGVPQNRERVFTVSIRKDIDKGNFVFPEKQELKIRLKDVLEDNVEEKYYLSEEVASKYVQSKETNTNVIGNLVMDKWQDSMKRIYDIEKYSPAINTMQGGNLEPKIITHNIPQKVKVRKYKVDTYLLKAVLAFSKKQTKISNSEISEKLNIPITQVEHYFRYDNSFAIPNPEIWFELKNILDIQTNIFDESIMTFEEKENRIYDEKGIAPTLTQQEEKILINNNTKKGYDEAVEGDSINLQYPNSTTRRGRVGHQVSQTLMASNNMGVIDKIKVIGNYSPSNHEASRIVDSNGLAPTVKENHGTVTATIQNLQIRKLTPKECWRLMGFSDEDFEKAANIPMSNTQLYKQAGNSIVVKVLEKIFENLLKTTKKTNCNQEILANGQTSMFMS